ncbi:hypothetical protein MOQ_003865 [Trypanosoma cruzi marinkellei]|uniref:Uncharacterized protein n=1 Tax=Trypanosoma cruzi marinkellei TaxID=85056 RepID=K2NBM0_TRYCR|nr:hypothetical protein MOQ_003865 [Trypanosoma cruzi marinkellei]
MRRLTLYCRGLGGREAFVSLRRFLRKRGTPKKEEIESVDSVDVPSLRVGGMMAAPDTSLDDIRSEILRMRSEHVRREEKVSENAASSVKEGSTMNDAWNDDIERLRSNEVYVKGHDVLERVKAKDRAVRKQLFLDAEEVLRKSNKEVTLRYLQLVYGRIGSYHREEVMESVKALLQLVEKETQEIKGRIQRNRIEKDSLAELDAIISSEEIKQMAWVNALTNMSDEDLKKLWKWGVLDLDTIESLACMDMDNDTHAVDMNLQESREAGKLFVNTTGQRQVEGEDDGVLDPTIPQLSIEENAEALQNVGEIPEFTATLYENLFLGFPNIDLAPVIQKVQEKQYENISESELRLLEHYEERKQSVNLSAPSTVTPSLKTTKKSEEKEVEKQRALGERFSEHTRILDTKTLPCKMLLTEAMMDRAFSPSNRFLHAVARCDPALRTSLEVMERIKRHALLDPVFQAAVEEAHSWEETSIQKHLQKDGVSAKGETRKQRRLRRAEGGVTPILGGPFAKPQHAADIPYYYGNIRSFVPPQGRYNMPAPRLSREEAAQLRNRELKRKKSRMRYSQ